MKSARGLGGEPASSPPPPLPASTSPTPVRLALALLDCFNSLGYEYHFYLILLIPG